MLTVNVSDTDGTQSLYEVTDVKYNANSIGSGAIGRKPCYGSVQITFANPMGDGKDTPYATGRTVYRGLVYVMNSDGKTVAKYDLGGWPIEEEPRVGMATLGP